MQSIQPSSITSSFALTSSPLGRAVALGGAVVGVLDALDGVVYFALKAGLNPIQVLQYIASGALGSRAFDGGLAAAGLGALIHFALAYAFTGAFIAAWPHVHAIRRHALAAGLGWGGAVWAFMNLIVLPQSNVAASPITAIDAIHGIISHGLFVGLPAAFIAKRVLRASLSHSVASDG